MKRILSFRDFKILYESFYDDIYVDLLDAIEDNDYDKVYELIKSGVDLNVRDKNGDSLLMFAALYGNNIDILKLLIENGADINAKNKWGDTVLMKVIDDGKIDVAKFLIQSGANVNTKNKFGETPLMYAAEYGHLDLAHFLIKSGANVNDKNVNGDVALFYALKYYDNYKSTGELHKMLDLLIKNGSEIDFIYDDEKSEDILEELIVLVLDVYKKYNR